MEELFVRYEDEKLVGSMGEGVMKHGQHMLHSKKLAGMYEQAILLLSIVDENAGISLKP